MYVDIVHQLISLDEAPKEKIRGIDIGTGASCIYALIAWLKYGWQMTATESD